jgi:hypothetical protein
MIFFNVCHEHIDKFVNALALVYCLYPRTCPISMSGHIYFAEIFDYFPICSETFHNAFCFNFDVAKVSILFELTKFFNTFFRILPQFYQETLPILDEHNAHKSID